MRKKPPAIRIREIPRLSLINGPSPLWKCQNLRSLFPGAPTIFMKRDDLSGFLCGGNKLRKLEYVMADALAQKATAVVSVGSVHSNHARVTALVARYLGLKSVLVLNGEASEKPRGNYLLSRMLSNEVRIVAGREERNGKMAEVAAELEARHEKVYRIPLGASNALGSLGLLAAFQELQTQSEALGIKFKALIVSSSSGGTQAGLEAGKRIFGWDDLRIIGISPDDRAEAIKENIFPPLQQLLDRFGAAGTVDKSDLEVDDRFMGRGYGIPSSASKKAADVFLKREGVLLDPVYTAKAGAALLDYCQTGLFRPRDNILFWHTGGLAALFT